MSAFVQPSRISFSHKTPEIVFNPSLTNGSRYLHAH